MTQHVSQQQCATDKHMHSALHTNVAFVTLLPTQFTLHCKAFQAKYVLYILLSYSSAFTTDKFWTTCVCVVHGTHNGDSCYASMHNMPPSLLQLEQVHGYGMANRLTFKYQFCYISWRNVPNEKHVAYTEPHVTRWAILRCGLTYQRCFLIYLVATCYQDWPKHNFTPPLAS
jgi:hypothetical protein